MTSTGEHGGGRKVCHRPTRAEHEQRLSQIHTLLVNTLSRNDICRFVSEKTTWGLTERSIERYIAAATKMIRASAAFDRDLELGRAIAQLRDLYSRSYRIQDYKMALAIKKEEIALLGLAAPKRLDVTGADGGPPSFIAIVPAPATDNEQWSAQCLREQAEIERQRTLASTPSGGP